jgi:molybdopterin converting factor subunit 1
MITLRMRYFAIIRELLGMSRESLQVPKGATAGEVLRLIMNRAGRPDGTDRSIMLMVNQQYVARDHVMHDGDELALIPPVSGGSEGTTPGEFVVTDEQLNAREIERRVSTGSSGAVVTFSGTVRNHARGKAVTALEYEAYPPAAERMLIQIADEIRERWEIEKIAISHRFGLLQIGDTSVVISVSAAHRAAAFDACRYAIERIKEIVPIWKKEIYSDGWVWIGSEADYQRERSTTDSPESGAAVGGDHQESNS